MSEKKGTPKSRDYLLVTFIEQLFEEGLAFGGEDDRTKFLNHTDFDSIRSIYQRTATAISLEERETLIRAAKSTLTSDCPLL